MNNLAWRTTEVPFNSIINTNSKENYNPILMNLTSQFLMLVGLNFKYIKYTKMFLGHCFGVKWTVKSQ